MDAGGAGRLNRSSPSCLNRPAQRTAFFHGLIERHVQKGAVGACTIPGLMKIKVMKKPAQRARKNVPNPFRPGETMDVQAKPASTSVKVLPLKKLKDMA